jgi:hypothetical protein
MTRGWLHVSGGTSGQRKTIVAIGKNIKWLRHSRESGNPEKFLSGVFIRVVRGPIKTAL